MNTSVFVTFWSTASNSGELNTHFVGNPLSLLRANPAVTAVEFYTQEPGDVPVLDTSTAPDLIIQIDFESEAPAVALTESPEFKALFLDEKGLAPPADRINIEILEPVHYDLPGQERPQPRTAQLSFVVRYYGPVNSAADFVEYYVDDHPPILAKFPKIRNVLCYLPLGWQRRREVADEEMIIGNEVVFDSLEDLNAALASEILAEAIAAGEKFASYGYSSHHAMHREMVYQR